jgi:hypothetical protein
MTRRKVALAIALGVASLAGLAGCGGGDEPSPGRYGAFFGVSPVGVPATPDFARMAAGGVGSYRLPLAWSTVEATKGTYDWSVTDATMAELAKNGIEPIANVTGTPEAYAPRMTDPPNSDPKTFDAWAKFLRAAAARYGPNGAFWSLFAAANPDVDPQPLQIWEIWNEPNTSLFWTPAPDPDAYVGLLKRSARVIEDVDPNAEIMLGGMFATPQSKGAITSFDFLDRVYAHPGMADVIDLVGVHPYGPDVPSVIDQLDRTRKTIDEDGDDAGLWVTELGWGSDPQVPNDLAKSPDEQAQLLSDSLGSMYDERDTWGLRGVVWFTWRDSEEKVGSCLWCRTAGLIDADGDSKPSWLAFTDLTGGEP